MEEQEIYGKLFEKIPLYNEGHLDVLLQSLNDGDSYQVGCWIGQNTRVRSKK